MTTETPAKRTMPRVRVTASTMARDDKMRKIVEALRERELCLVDVCEVLAMSPSGGRKYIADLLAAGVMMVGHYKPHPASHPMSRFGETAYYRLTANADVVDAFLAQIDNQQIGDLKDRKKEAARHLHGRAIHLVSDDIAYPFKMPSLAVPPPDPLLAAFYGFSGAV